MSQRRKRPETPRKVPAAQGGHASVHSSAFELQLLLLGALAPDRAAAVEQHLLLCDACRAEHDALVQARDEFEREILPRRGGPDEPPPPGRRRPN